MAGGILTATAKKTVEQKLLEKQEQIAAQLKAIADKKKSAQREKDARLDQLIGTVCRADKALHETIKAALDRGVKAPKDREFLKAEGWL
jgi:hypothetical protein